MSIHKPLVDHTPEEINNILNDSGFYSSVNSTMVGEYFFLVTGTNVPDVEQREFMLKISQVLGEQTSYIFIKHEPPKLFSSVQRDRSPLLISSAVVIPRALSQSGQTEICLPVVTKA